MKTAAEKIADMAAKMQNITPQEAESARLIRLENEYLLAKEAEDHAPAATAKAEEEYLTAKDGKDGYSQAMSARHAETARRYQREATEQRDEDVSRIDAGLSAYATATNYAKNIESVVLQQLEEIIVIADQIDARNNSRRINNRKSMFLDIQRSSLYQWDARLTGTIWILALAYARESGAFVSINPVAWLIVSGLVVSPWVIGWVSWLVGKKVPRFNVYTTFTE